MTNFVKQLKLAEKAAEDIYFAKVNRQLIERLHLQMEAEENVGEASDQPGAPLNSRDSVTQ